MSKMSELDADRQQIQRLTDFAPPPSFAVSGRAGRIVPPPPEPEPIWLHGTPSLIQATVVVVCFASYALGLLGFVIWNILKAGAS